MLSAPSFLRRGSGWLLLLGLLLAPGWSQDVFCGGRVDVEFVSDRSTRFSFGREAGLDGDRGDPQPRVGR